MNRRGAALLIVLWMVVMLTALVGSSMAGARRSMLEGQNRIALVRAGWAREACLEVVIGRAAGDSQPPLSMMARLSIDSLDLGQGTWCSIHLTDPGTQLNINLADSIALLGMIGEGKVVDEIMRGRPWPSILALTEVIEPWQKFLTTRGTGRVTMMIAPVEVLRAVPGLDDAGARAIVRAREYQGTVSSLEQVVSWLPKSSRERVMSQYAAFAGTASVQPQLLIASVAGHTALRPVVARMTVTLVPAGRRLAVTRREVE